MGKGSFSVHIKGYYDTRQTFQDEAIKLIKTKVAEHTGIPLSDIGSVLSGEWQSVAPTESPTKKQFTGEVVLDHVLDKNLGYEWNARIEVVSIGEYDEEPCEQFAGQMQLVVFE